MSELAVTAASQSRRHDRHSAVAAVDQELGPLVPRDLAAGVDRLRLGVVVGGVAGVTLAPWR